MSYTKIRYTVSDAVATIELNDPPANTYSYEMMREIDAAVLEARMDRAVHGIVNDVWDDAALAGKSFADAAQEYARQFTPPNKASKAVGRIKRAVQSGVEMSFTDGLALERELQQLLFESDDAREGIAANLEKRKSIFKGQ